jgi:hypothetical protein
MASGPADEMVDVTVSFMRDQDCRLMRLLTKATRAELGTSRMLDLSLASWGSLGNYEQVSFLMVELGRPVVLSTAEMLNSYVNELSRGLQSEARPKELA